MVALLALDRSPDRFFGVGHGYMDFNRTRLTKPPAAADRLIELLVTEGQAGESNAGAVLPVQTKPCDGWLCDDHAALFGELHQPAAGVQHRRLGRTQGAGGRFLTAQDIYKRATGGEDFAQLAVAYSNSQKALEGGAIANPDENRMVGHYWLRAPQLAPNQEIRDEIELTVGRINGDYGTISHQAVSYLHHGFPREEMAALLEDLLLKAAVRGLSQRGE